MKRVPLLINKAFDLGFEVTAGDLYRDDRCDYGAKNSLHRQRLAIDLNLFKDGVYLTKTDDHHDLGVFWESLGGVWGGRFRSNPDGNHYQAPRHGWHPYRVVVRGDHLFYDYENTT